MRVSSSSRFRMAPNSRAISASVSSVLRVLARVLEEPRVLDRDGDVGAELPQQRLVGFGELPGRVAEEVERADHAPLAAQRHDELRGRAGHRLHVPRIRADVVDENRLAFGDGGADQPVAHLHPELPDDIVRVADGVGDRQLLASRIEQVHGERLELRDARDEQRDLLEQLVEIEDGRDLPSELEQGDDELASVRRRGRSRSDGVGHETTSIIASFPWT